MSKIYKYKLDNKNKLKIPIGSKILDVGLDHDSNWCFWVLLHQEEKFHEVEIEILFTGEEFSSCIKRKYLKTIENGIYVYHFFEVLS